jgi:PAS domain S-box-containing protein
MSVDRRAKRRGMHMWGIVLPLTFAAAGFGLSFVSFSQARQTVESRLHGGFRFDAHQRSELVQGVLGESQRDFDSLLRFYACSQDVTRRELEDFTRPWIESGLFRGFLWLSPAAAAELEHAPGRIAPGPAIYIVPAPFSDAISRDGAAASAPVSDAIAAAVGIARASASGRGVVPCAAADGRAGNDVAVAARLNGSGGFLSGLISLPAAVAMAIGSSPPVGLPTAIYDLSEPSSPLLLMFHKPRLDAQRSRPIEAPDPNAKLSATQKFDFLGSPWAVRVEASPAYLELRRSALPTAILALGLSLSVTAALYVGRLFSRGAAAEAEAGTRSAELARYFALGRDLFCIADSFGRLRRVNEEWTRSLGYEPKNLMGRPFMSLVLHEDRMITRIALRSLARGEDIDGFTHRVKTADGGFRWLEWRAAADHDSGLSYAAARDVTERVRTEEILKSSVREKEALIREIHHRVKNNMQVISSLVSLESRMSRAPDASEGVRRIQGLVRAMSLVHEAVYCSPALDAVRMAPYIRDLVAAEASVAPASSTRIDVSVGEASLGIDLATLCGLAVDELVANSIRYASTVPHPEGETPALIIEGGERAGGGFWLAVKDNGPGIPDEAERAGGFGLPLVEALVAQMDGELLIAGSRAEIRLPPV